MSFLKVCNFVECTIVAAGNRVYAVFNYGQHYDGFAVRYMTALPHFTMQNACLLDPQGERVFALEKIGARTYTSAFKEVVALFRDSVSFATNFYCKLVVRIGPRGCQFFVEDRKRHICLGVAHANVFVHKSHVGGRDAEGVLQYLVPLREERLCTLSLDSLLSTMYVDHVAVHTETNTPLLKPRLEWMLLDSEQLVEERFHHMALDGRHHFFDETAWPVDKWVYLLPPSLKSLLRAVVLRRWSDMRALFCALWHGPRTASGYSDLSGRLPRVRWLTNAGSLTPVRHRLVHCLVPCCRARAFISLVLKL
jgi:hypothetical protein